MWLLRKSFEKIFVKIHNNMFLSKNDKMFVRLRPSSPFQLPLVLFPPEFPGREICFFPLPNQSRKGQRLISNNHCTKPKTPSYKPPSIITETSKHVPSQFKKAKTRVLEQAHTISLKTLTIEPLPNSNHLSPFLCPSIQFKQWYLYQFCFSASPVSTTPSVSGCRVVCCWEVAPWSFFGFSQRLWNVGGSQSDNIDKRWQK